MAHTPLPERPTPPLIIAGTRSTSKSSLLPSGGALPQPELTEIEKAELRAASNAALAAFRAMGEKPKP